MSKQPFAWRCRTHVDFEDAADTWDHWVNRDCGTWCPDYEDE